MKNIFTLIILLSSVFSIGQITIVNGTCQCPNTTVGDTEIINGVTYTAVDNSTIAGQIANGNVNLCTTLVTSMVSLFADNTSFNSDVSFWDTCTEAHLEGSGGGGRHHGAHHVGGGGQPLLTSSRRQQKFAQCDIALCLGWEHFHF